MRQIDGLVEQRKDAVCDAHPIDMRDPISLIREADVAQYQVAPDRSVHRADKDPALERASEDRVDLGACEIAEPRGVAEDRESDDQAYDESEKCQRDPADYFAQLPHGESEELPDAEIDLPPLVATRRARRGNSQVQAQRTDRGLVHDRGTEAETDRGWEGVGVRGGLAEIEKHRAGKLAINRMTQLDRAFEEAQAANRIVRG